MMAEKSIRLTTEEVKAVLDGRKTQKRIVIKGLGNSWHVSQLLGDWGLSKPPEIKDGVLYWELQTEVDDSRVFKANLPYKPGDILWVRETWKYYEKAVGYAENFHVEKFLAYKADQDNNNIQKSSEWFEGNWRASIHMPREAARLFLRVTNVRVERLQDITDSDGWNEGFERDMPFCDINECDSCLDECSSRSKFRTVWNSTIKKKDLDKYGWNANPWCWVIEFERVEL